MREWLETGRTHCGDAMELLRRIEPDSISLSVWSPPYFVGKTYEAYLEYEEWRHLITSAIGEHYRLLRPGGFLVVNIADILCFKDPLMPRVMAENIRRRCAVTREDVLAAKEQHPGANRNELAAVLGCSEQTVDRRLNGNNVRGGKYEAQTRVHLVGGLVEQAGAAAGLYMYDRRVWVKDPAWQNSRWHTLSYRAVDEFEDLYFLWKPGITRVDRSRLTSEEWVAWGSRAVWHIPSVRVNDDHEAKFPIELVCRLIQLLTDPGEIVLDCFMGSGTTAAAATRAGREFIGIELAREYVDLAEKRVARERGAASGGDDTGGFRPGLGQRANRL